MWLLLDSNVQFSVRKFKARVLLLRYINQSHSPPTNQRTYLPAFLSSYHIHTPTISVLFFYVDLCLPCGTFLQEFRLTLCMNFSFSYT